MGSIPTVVTYYDSYNRRKKQRDFLPCFKLCLGYKLPLLVPTSLVDAEMQAEEKRPVWTSLLGAYFDVGFGQFLEASMGAFIGFEEISMLPWSGVSLIENM